jgi:hypothetical protein
VMSAEDFFEELVLLAFASAIIPVGAFAVMPAEDFFEELVLLAFASAIIPVGAFAVMPAEDFFEELVLLVLLDELPDICFATAVELPFLFTLAILLEVEPVNEFIEAFELAEEFALVILVAVLLPFAPPEEEMSVVLDVVLVGPTLVELAPAMLVLLITLLDELVEDVTITGVLLISTDFPGFNGKTLLILIMAEVLRFLWLLAEEFGLGPVPELVVDVVVVLTEAGLGA